MRVLKNVSALLLTAEKTDDDVKQASDLIKRTLIKL
jgi:hypothetical protein